MNKDTAMKVLGLVAVVVTGIESGLKTGSVANGIFGGLTALLAGVAGFFHSSPGQPS